MLRFLPVLLLPHIVFAQIPTRPAAPNANKRPNVIVIITDDQGYGDLGINGNPVLQTPNLDRFARQGATLRNFYVSPVCAPTRASLMTGRYNYRTGVVDTYLGRAMMYADERTLAEVLKEAGYRTGIFGKWHLGDNYPMRPMDQGFEEALVHRGGGLAQPSDPHSNVPLDRRYFDPLLEHNGKLEKAEGYCSDVFTNGAIRFLSAHAEESFFLYLAYNCPHLPLQVPESYVEPYQNVSLSADVFPKIGYPLQEPNRRLMEDTKRVYGMVTNVDENIGRLLTRLDTLGLSKDTIVVFLTDNGPQQPRYNAGLRDRKGSVFEGGIRAPCIFRWPEQIPAEMEVHQAAAHIDLFPTILAACGIDYPTDRVIDGVNLLPVLQHDSMKLPDRNLFFQWHRGDRPERYRSFAVRGPRFKLVGPGNPMGTVETSKKTFMLFDLEKDPYEIHNIAELHMDIVEQLTGAYETWFHSVTSERNGVLPRIVIDAHKDPIVLTRQDWRGVGASWEVRGNGYWELQNKNKRKLSILARIPRGITADHARLRLGSVMQDIPVKRDTDMVVFEIEAAAGPLQLQVELFDAEGSLGPDSVEVVGN